jgi:hypothetical protein
MMLYNRNIIKIRKIFGDDEKRPRTDVVPPTSSTSNLKLQGERSIMKYVVIILILLPSAVRQFLSISHLIIWRIVKSNLDSETIIPNLFRWDRL